MRDDRDLLRYVRAHTTPEDPVLAELDRETHLRTVHPRMLSGQVQGHILRMLTDMLRPRRAVEIGTFTGYSAICIGRGLPEGGVLHTIDVNDETASLAGKYIRMAGLEDRVRQHIGSALEVIPTLGERFDLAFIDGDKREYVAYYDLLMDGGYMNPGGYLLADNVLWDGKVLETEESCPKLRKDVHTLTLQAFNRKVREDARVEVVLLPFRDGMSLIRVKGR